MIEFTKMHGLGNDYVCVDARRYPIGDPSTSAVQLTDRFRGVGADGLILLLPPQAGVDADLRMRIFNSDGSESEMCGNGIRCACKLAHESGLTTSRPMRIETGRGVLVLDYETDDQGQVREVTVDMGEPIMTPTRIPVEWSAGDDAIVDAPLPDDLLPERPADWIHACGVEQRMTCVSTGNPHVVLFCADVERVPIREVGPSMEHHRLFPNRANVHFVEVRRRDHVAMVTWERGSGATQACGTGASAVCVAAALTGRTDDGITARLPGGTLALRWDRPSNHVFMTGEAVAVFRGRIEESC